MYLIHSTETIFLGCNNKILCLVYKNVGANRGRTTAIFRVGEGSRRFKPHLEEQKFIAFLVVLLLEIIYLNYVRMAFTSLLFF